MLIGKNLTSELACFSIIGRWIVTEEVDRTIQVVPAKFHFEERRARKLRQSFSPELARPLDYGDTAVANAISNEKARFKGRISPPATAARRPG